MGHNGEILFVVLFFCGVLVPKKLTIEEEDKQMTNVKQRKFLETCYSLPTLFLNF